MTDKKMQVVFAPGCFDSFEGTQEELDTMMAEIARMVESGEFLEKSQPVDVDAMDAEELEELARMLGIDEHGNTSVDSDPDRKLQ